MLNATLFYLLAQYLLMLFFSALTLTQPSCRIISSDIDSLELVTLCGD